ncbi:MAG: PQQ-binding-like beta-propeller repeat protein [Candidatus Methanoperedens sp.]|nr:PQQ-binding-like beta-propeller repeat protein [Candidatus Methanoperedens sp.]
MKKRFTLILLLILITPAFAGDWNMFKNDATRSGYSDDVVNAPLTLKWTKELGFETDSSPVIANDVLYIGSTYGIFALDAKTGNELWRYHTNGFITSVPAVSNGVVYIGADDRKFYAIDAKNGTLKWMNDNSLDGYSASAVVLNNVVYAIPKDGTFYAFDGNNGQIVWSTLIGKRSESSPAVGDGIIGFGTDRGEIVALDAATGKLKWSYDTGVSDIRSSPVITNGTIIVGSNDGSIYALTTEKGALKWKYSTRDNVESSPAVKNGIVYAGSRDSGFLAIDSETGNTRWKFPDSGQVISSPAISNNVVYFGTKNNFIYGLDANTGQRLWRNSTGPNDKDYITSPAISGNVLYAATHSGIIYAFSSGKESAQTPSIEKTTGAPVISPTPTISTTRVDPTTSSPQPEQTEKSPGFEYSVLVILVTGVISIYFKKK